MDGLIIKEKWLRLILSGLKSWEIRGDHLEHIRQTSPDRIQRRNDAADGLRAAVITAYESGVLK